MKIKVLHKNFRFSHIFPDTKFQKGTKLIRIKKQILNRICLCKQI